LTGKTESPRMMQMIHWVVEIPPQAHLKTSPLNWVRIA